MFPDFHVWFYVREGFEGVAQLRAKVAVCVCQGVNMCYFDEPKPQVVLRCSHCYAMITLYCCDLYLVLSLGFFPSLQKIKRRELISQGDVNLID